MYAECPLRRRQLEAARSNETCRLHDGDRRRRLRRRQHATSVQFIGTSERLIHRSASCCNSGLLLLIPLLSPREPRALTETRSTTPHENVVSAAGIDQQLCAGGGGDYGGARAAVRLMDQLVARVRLRRCTAQLTCASNSSSSSNSCLSQLARRLDLYKPRYNEMCTSIEHSLPDNQFFLEMIINR